MSKKLDYIKLAMTEHGLKKALQHDLGIESPMLQDSNPLLPAGSSKEDMKEALFERIIKKLQEKQQTPEQEETQGDEEESTQDTSDEQPEQEETKSQPEESTEEVPKEETPEDSEENKDGLDDFDEESIAAPVEFKGDDGTSEDSKSKDSEVDAENLVVGSLRKIQAADEIGADTVVTEDNYKDVINSLHGLLSDSEDNKDEEKEEDKDDDDNNKGKKDKKQKEPKNHILDVVHNLLETVKTLIDTHPPASNKKASFKKNSFNAIREVMAVDFEYKSEADAYKKQHPDSEVKIVPKKKEDGKEKKEPEEKSNSDKKSLPNESKPSGEKKPKVVTPKLLSPTPEQIPWEGGSARPEPKNDNEMKQRKEEDEKNEKNILDRHLQSPSVDEDTLNLPEKKELKKEEKPKDKLNEELSKLDVTKDVPKKPKTLEDNLKPIESEPPHWFSNKPLDTGNEKEMSNKGFKKNKINGLKMKDEDSRGSDIVLTDATNGKQYNFNELPQDIQKLVVERNENGGLWHAPKKENKEEQKEETKETNKKKVDKKPITKTYSPEEVDTIKNSKDYGDLKKSLDSLKKNVSKGKKTKEMETFLQKPDEERTVGKLMNYLKSLFPSGNKKSSSITSKLFKEAMAVKIANEFVNAIKDKDLMSDTGGISKGRQREPSMKPSRSDLKNRYRERLLTKEEKEERNK